MTLSDNTGTPDAIHLVQADNSGDFNVVVKNRIIFVENASRFEVYTSSGAKVASNASQRPGLYIVKAGHATKKIVVR